MKVQIEEIKRPIITRTTIIKIGFSAAFLFLIYIIWSGTAELSRQLKAVSDKSLAVHNLQVEYKGEVQEWKNLLLRSDNKASLDKNWQAFEAKHQSVAASAQKIIQQNDERRITDPIKDFSTAHAANFEQYKISKDVLIKSGFAVQQADTVVAGIDRPLLNDLEKAAVAMQEEQNNINDRVAGKTSHQIEQYLIVLALVSLLVVWMPKW